MSDRKDTANFDNALGELRAVRNLEAVASSIDTFLSGQIEKIEASLRKCQEAFTQHRLLQERIIEFENRKDAWDAAQKLESQRLFEIGEKLIEGWDQLEKERQELRFGQAGDKQAGD